MNSDLLSAHNLKGIEEGPTFLDQVRGLLFGLVLTLGLFVSFVMPRPFSDQVNLEVGDVSERDIRAPSRITYLSNLLTEREREQAAAAVREVYNPPQTSIVRQQISRAREILDYIESIRSDPYGTPAQHIAWIRAIPDLNLSTDTIEKMLALSPESWQRVAREIPLVLDRAMREEIREGQVASARRIVPALVSLDLNDEEGAVSIELIRALLVPNTFLNVERTQAEREAAREAVAPVYATLEAGEIIVRAGDIIDELDMEALTAAGLLQQPQGWHTYLGHFLFAFLLALYYSLVIYHFKPRGWLRKRQPWLLALLIIGFALIAQFMVPSRTVLPYVFPIATATLLVSILLDLRFALTTTALLIFIIGYITDGSVEMMAYGFLGGLIGAMVLDRGERLAAFVLAGVAIALTNLIVLATFRLPAGGMDLSGILELVSAALVNGALSTSLTIVGLLLIGPLFGTLTLLQLMDLSRPNHPLLRQLLLTAPGTYHHTLLVGNMAERAAAAIGADAFLTRVGAFYHDIGKMSRPYFFKENQMEGQNPHDHLDPETSAQIIIGHVAEGVAMARAYRLPARIRDFIQEHHGTTLVSYFYRKCCEEKQEPVKEEPFRYPGPRPSSKETAILMLADICEAAVRAIRPASVEELDQLVARLIGERLADGELDDSHLTLYDLDRIRRAFVSVLQGVHHPRVRYPEGAIPSANGSPAVAAPSEQRKSRSSTLLTPGPATSSDS